jgi:hypothetical protein
MIDLRTHDGRHFRTLTAEQMVGRLWKDAFLTEASPGEYMRAVARRSGELGDRPPRTDTATHFLEDLEALEVVTIDWRS